MIAKDTLRYTFKKKNIFLVNRAMTLPTGMKVNVDVVLHPGAVLIVPFLGPDQIIMLRQYRPAIKQYLYEFPAGTLDHGEKPSHCAHRELMEEAGYRARKLKKMGVIVPVPGYSDEQIFIFKAHDLVEQKEAGDSDEVIEPLIMSKAKIRQLFKSGKIIDAKTIAGLAFCGLLT